MTKFIIASFCMTKFIICDSIFVLNILAGSLEQFGWSYRRGIKRSLLFYCVHGFHMQASNFVQFQILC